MEIHDQTSVRAAAIKDLPYVTEIYSSHVLRGLGTFEETPPNVSEMQARFESIVSAGRPYLIAERGGRVCGYCYAGTYRPRAAYRFTLEDTVYVEESSVRSGIGRALLTELISRCSRGVWRQMVAVIGDSANSASIALHRRCGFEIVGTLRDVGFKHGRWVDSVVMQRALGAGAREPPTG